MWKLQDYRYAGSATEAVAMLRAGPGTGLYIAGGTDLMLFPPADCDFVVDVNNAGLSDIVRTGDGDLFIGAAAPLEDIVGSPLVTSYAGGAIAEAAAKCGNRPVRTVATIGGNLCSALPSADLAPVLLALEAKVHIADQQDQQKLALADFFQGPRQTVLGDRLLVGISLRADYSDLVVAQHKLTRCAEDIGLVLVAVAIRFDDGKVDVARIALGAVAPTPMRAPAAEALLIGFDPSSQAPEQIESLKTQVAAAAAGATQPIDDHRASAEYRRAMVEVLVHRLLNQLLHPGGGR